MSMQHFGKGALRVAKNYTKGYSDVQSKVRDATSNDPWGPSGTQMNDIAQMTYNQNDFVEIMEMLDKRLNDKGKNWRHVFKALTVLDYCLHAGSENTVIYFKDNLYVIKTLKEFQFVDEYSKDQGANVRQKAKDITNLLTDDARLREERRSRASMRDRMVRGGADEFGGPSASDELENENERRRRAQQLLGAPKGKAAPKEEDDMKRALEASRRSLADEQRRIGEETDLAKALALSEAEEAARKRALQDGGALFDDQTQASPANGGGDLLIDFNGGQQQQLQPQFTSFNPYMQQAQQQAQQEEYLRQQNEWNAMQQQAQQQALQQAQQQAQQEEWQRQQMMAQQQAQQQAQQDEWNRQQQQQQQLLFQQQQQQQQQQFLMGQQMSPIMAQPTGYGSNNPFAMMQAPNQQSPAPPQSLSPFPSQPTISERPTPSPQPSLTQQNTMSNARRTPAPANDGANTHLAHLIANREDGQDTFGNIGQLRFGHGQTAQRLQGQPTGAPNPFGAPQQSQSEQPFFTV